MTKLQVFLLGMKEFRHGFTAGFDTTLRRWYDRGRKTSHALTLRVFVRG